MLKVKISKPCTNDILYFISKNKKLLKLKLKIVSNQANV